MSIPDASAIEEAWHSLPTEIRDRIGLIALDMVFQAFVSGDAYSHEDRPVQDENLCHQACEASCKRLGQLHIEIEAALPALFGPAGENPAWSATLGPQPGGDAMISAELPSPEHHAMRGAALLLFPDHVLGLAAGVRGRPLNGLAGGGVQFRQRRRRRSILLLNDWSCTTGGRGLLLLRQGRHARQGQQDKGIGQLHGHLRDRSERARTAAMFLSAHARRSSEVRVDGLLDVHGEDAEAERTDDLGEEHDGGFPVAGVSGGHRASLCSHYRPPQEVFPDRDLVTDFGPAWLGRGG